MLISLLLLFFLLILLPIYLPVVLSCFHVNLSAPIVFLSAYPLIDLLAWCSFLLPCWSPDRSTCLIIFLVTVLIFPFLLAFWLFSDLPSCPIVILFSWWFYFSVFLLILLIEIVCFHVFLSAFHVYLYLFGLSVYPLTFVPLSVCMLFLGTAWLFLSCSRFALYLLYQENTSVKDDLCQLDKDCLDRTVDTYNTTVKHKLLRSPLIITWHSGG